MLKHLIDDGAVSLYHDYRSGSFRDYSGNGNHGVPIGDPVLTGAGMLPPAQTGGFVVVNDCDIVSPSGGTYMVLVEQQGETTSTSSLCRFTADSGDSLFFGLYATTPSSLYLFDGASGSATTNTLDVRGRRTYAATFATGEAPDGYVDGAYHDDGNGALSFPTMGNGDISIGSSNPSSLSNAARSIIQAVCVFNRKLTAEEIAGVHDDLVKKVWPSMAIVRTGACSLIDLGQPGLVHAYDFSNGSLVDLVGSNDGTISGAIDVHKGSYCSMVRGDGIGHVDLGSIDTSSGSFFVSLDYLHQTGTGTKYLTGIWQDASDNFDLLLSGNTLLLYDDIGGASAVRYSTGSILKPGKMYHIVFGIDSNNVCKLWIDGVPSDNDESASSSISTVDGALSVLTTGGSSALRVPGSVGNVEVFDADITDADVDAMYARRARAVSVFSGGVIASEREIIGPGAFLENTPLQIISGGGSVSEEQISGAWSRISNRYLTDYSFASYSEFGVTPAQAGYGTWQFTMRHSGGQARMVLSASDMITSYLGFFARIEPGDIQLWRNLSSPFLTYGTPPTAGTWYTIRVTRDYQNTFKMWVKPEGGDWFFCGQAVNSFYPEAPYFGTLLLSGDCSVALSSDNPDYALQYSPAVIEVT